MATVPGSRRPITIVTSTPPIATTPAPIEVAVKCISEVTSSRRRKPQITFRSPSTAHPVGPCIEAPTLALLSHSAPAKVLLNTQNKPRLSGAPISRSTATSSSSSSSGASAPASGARAPNFNDASRQRASHYSLYHPLGRLALSLPELDPRAFGITTVGTVYTITAESVPTAPVAAITSNARTAARSRRPAARARPSADSRTAVPKASPRLHEFAPAAGASAVLTQESAQKDDKSPRKRRTGGGAGGAAAKRKRRDADEDGGSAAYPASKRTRGGQRGAAQGDADLVSPVDDTPAGEDDEKDGSGGSVKEKRPTARRARTSRRAPAARTRRKDSPTTASEGAGDEADIADAVDEADADTVETKHEADADEKSSMEKQPTTTEGEAEIATMDHLPSEPKAESPAEEGAPASSPAPTQVHMKDADTNTAMEVDVPPPVAPQVSLPEAPAPPPAPTTVQPTREEKEDGELSEEGDAPPMQ